jgi:hypothetical protein
MRRTPAWGLEVVRFAHSICFWLEDRILDSPPDKVSLLPLGGGVRDL